MADARARDLRRLREILEPMTRMDSRRDEILGLLDSALAAPEAGSGIDVERLARAMARCAEVGPPAHHTPEQAEEHWREYLMEAEEYAAAYAAAAQSGEGEGDAS